MEAHLRHRGPDTDVYRYSPTRDQNVRTGAFLLSTSSYASIIRFLLGQLMLNDWNTGPVYFINKIFKICPLILGYPA
jgi:hypothetical protein